MNERIEKLREMCKIQGYDGNWNYDPYMMGLYNGLEFAVSIVEDRDPVFKSQPEQWLKDIPTTHILSKEAEIEG